MKVKIIMIFSTDDVDCSGDYYEVDVVVNGQTKITYGDAYHEKGLERAEGFVDCLKIESRKGSIKSRYSVKVVYESKPLFDLDVCERI